MYKVLITTSGIGSRLGDLTNYTNKSLIRVGKKPSISYIIEKYPDNIEIIVTVGHFSEHVRDFLNISYPNKKITFVDIDNFDGDGSSLGYSMLLAKDHLQCPFIFNASDTIIEDDIPIPDSNWIFVSKRDDNSQYRTLTENFGKIKIHEKGYLCKNKNVFVHIGLIGIKDYDFFWKNLEKEYNENTNNKNLCDCNGINSMNAHFNILETKTWLDIGNFSELTYAREHIKDKFEILDKVNESIFIFDEFVIKFFYNKEIAKNRATRCEILGDLTPKLLNYKNNFYKYEYVKGDLLSNIINERLFEQLLDWSLKELWIKTDSVMFSDKCYNFYFEKTLKRINMFLEKNNIIDKEEYINGFLVPPVKDMIEKLDSNLMCSKQSYIYHGDYILDNIIYDNGNFKLIDWRQDFDGDLINGDIYYDIGKLNHNLIFNHSIVNKKLFTIEYDDNYIKCDILRSDILINCQKILHKWCLLNNIDLYKLNILTSIIWLNMSPLHDDNIGKFLFYFGKLNLYKNTL